MTSGELPRVLDIELTDKEIHFIGQIVAHWGALEYQIFTQTLLSFEPEVAHVDELPKELNNLQFARVLELWHERVVQQADEEVARVLQQQHDLIVELKQFRDALVHGMWTWTPSDINKITTVRVRKREIISIDFNADDLFDFYMRVAQINFKLRYPRGIEDLAAERSQGGAHISRRFLSMVTKNEIAGDWMPPLQTDDESKV